jgi:hypothetical protein
LKRHAKGVAAADGDCHASWDESDSPHADLDAPWWQTGESCDATLIREALATKALESHVHEG